MSKIVTVNVPWQVIEDLLRDGDVVNAVAYWAADLEVHQGGGQVTVIDHDRAARGESLPLDWGRAVRVLWEHPELMRVIARRDRTSADLLTQLAAFGTVRFG